MKTIISCVLLFLCVYLLIDATHHHTSLFSVIDRLQHPGYSHCGRCGMTWATVKEHDTPYETNRGMFPLCEACWSSLTPVERLPYYKSVWEMWEKDTPGHAKWEDIEASVMAGK